MAETSIEYYACQLEVTEIRKAVDLDRYHMLTSLCGGRNLHEIGRNYLTISQNVSPFLLLLSSYFFP